VGALAKLAADSAEMREALERRRASLAAILKRKYSKGDRREARAELGLVSGKIELLNWLDGEIRRLSITHREWEGSDMTEAKNESEQWLRGFIRAEVGRMAQEHDTVLTPGRALEMIGHVTDRIDQLEELFTRPQAPRLYSPPIDTPEAPAEGDRLANDRTPWSAAEDERLRGEFEVFVAEAARDHQRSLGAIRVRLSELRVAGGSRRVPTVRGERRRT
jgi:hypothetical protein